MASTYNCLWIDDDPLFVRKISVFIESINWLNLVDTFNNPIHGAKAIFEIKPDLLFLDVDMPHVDGNYLLDWVGPRLEKLENAPKIIIVSSLVFAEEDKLPSVAGYINKGDVTSAEKLEGLIKAIVG